MKACSTMLSPEAPSLASSLLDSFRAYADVSSNGDNHVIRFRYGAATLTVASDRIGFTAEADDDIRLSYVKMAVAEHWVVHFPDPDRAIEWEGISGADHHPAFFQTIEVVSAQMVTPRIKRIRFRGAGFGGYVSGGLHVRLLFAPKDCQPVWPSVGADGRIIWPVGEDTVSARVYTIRSISPDSSEIEIDFVLHDNCGVPAPGSDFAEQADCGQQIGIFAPGGNEIPAGRSLLLLGDETAFPAMARIIEALPADSHARVFAEVENPQSHYDFPNAGNVAITYLYRESHAAEKNGLLTRALQDHIGTMEKVPEFLWAGCEYKDFMAIRKIARDELGMPRNRHLVVAYWRKR